MAHLMLNESWGQSYKIKFRVVQYENERLAIQMLYYDKDCEQYMPYASLTVNIPWEACNDNHAFVDTNNCGEKMLKWIIDNNLGMQTGRFVRSGHCAYPEVHFNLNEVMKYV